MNKRVYEAIVRFELSGWSVLRITTNTGMDIYVCTGNKCVLLGSLQDEV